MSGITASSIPMFSKKSVTTTKQPKQTKLNTKALNKPLNKDVFVKSEVQFSAQAKAPKPPISKQDFLFKSLALAVEENCPEFIADALEDGFPVDFIIESDTSNGLYYSSKSGVAVPKRHTLLSKAIAENQPDLVKLILLHKPDLSKPVYQGIMHQAIEAQLENRVLETMIHLNAPVNLNNLKAAVNRYKNPTVPQIKLLLAQGLNLDDVQFFSDHALYNACYDGKEEIVNLLLPLTKRQDILDASLNNALRSPQTETGVFKALLKAGANADGIIAQEPQRDSQFFSLVHHTTHLPGAMLWGRDDISDEEYAALQAKNLIPEAKAIAIFSLLKKAGADLTVTNNQGQTLADVARKHKKTELADYLDSVTKN